MTSAICDSGPLTHLWQIDLWSVFGTLSALHIPDLVADEVADHVELGRLAEFVGSDPLYHNVSSQAITDMRSRLAFEFQFLQDADLSILCLNQSVHPEIVLTDDLLLRRAIEQMGFAPMGTVGLLLRAYRFSFLTEQQLRHSVERLFVHSTLYLSPRFKAYTLKLIEDSIARPGGDTPLAAR